MIITTAATLAFSGATIHKLPTLGITSSPQISHQSLSNKSEPTSPKIEDDKIAQARQISIYQTLLGYFGRYVNICIPNRGCITIVPAPGSDGYLPFNPSKDPIIASVDFRQIYQDNRIFGRFIVYPNSWPFLRIEANSKEDCPEGSEFFSNPLQTESGETVNYPYCALGLTGAYIQ